MRATFISLNKFIIIVYLTIYLIILIMYYKYYYSFTYNWSKFKKVNFSGNENDFYFGTKG
jgi:Na+/H+-dicarboxylate symporter